MSEKQTTNFARFKIFLRVMKISTLYIYYENAVKNNIKKLTQSIKYCKFPEEEIEKIKNYIINFWEKEVTSVLDENYNKNSFLSYTEIKRFKEKNPSN